MADFPWSNQQPSALASLNNPTVIQPQGSGFADALMRLAAATNGANSYQEYTSGRAGAGNTPSAIQEYQYYMSLPPEQQKEYLRVKRAEQWLNAGGQFVNPAGAAPIPKTLPPQDQPKVRGEQARQAAVGTKVGEFEGGQEKKALQAPQVIELLDEADKLLPKATSGGAATLGRDIAGFVGTATEGSDADSQLDVIGAALTSGVPRMEGPQSNFDVKLYEKAAGDLANSKLPISRRQAASKTIRKLQEKYTTGGLGSPQGGTVPLSVDAPPGKLIGTSGVKVYELPDGSHVMEE